MKILIITFTFPPQANGVSQVSYNHALLLRQYGHEVVIATSYNEHRKDETSPFEIYEFDVSGNANIRSRYKGEIKKYENFIKDFKCDVIFCHAWQNWSTDLAVKAFKNNPAKKIFISHGVSANGKTGFPRTLLSWILWRPYIWRMPLMMDSFDHLVFLSTKEDKDRFYDFFLFNKRKKANYSIIPNGVDFYIDENKNLDEDFRQKYFIPTDSFMILNVSNYSPMKNQLFVLESFLKSDIDGTLVFIGSHQNLYSEKLEDYYNSQILSDKKRVIFLNSVPRNMILRAYRTANLFCMGSKTEYFPLVIIEAMMSKTTWISTNVGCVSTLAGGTIVQDISEMTKYINYYASDIKENESLSNKGYDYAKEYLDWSIIGKNLDNLLQKLDFR